LDDFEEKCTVVDFGGALGASYRQCQPYLRSVRDLNWCIVEQEKTVELGRSRFQTERLFFKRSVAECFRDFEPPFVLILSGVLQYLPEPMSELSSLLRRPFDHVIVDRTLLTRSSESKVFVQRVSPKMYDASYPFWEVAENVLLAQFADDFECIALDDLRRPNNIGGREFPEYAYHFRRTERHRPQR
jgi:putative methyltransferase (TIGR04325 family)